MVTKRVGHGFIGPIKFRKWVSSILSKALQGSLKSRIMFVIICTPKKRTTQHQSDFLMPFAPSQSPPHLQKQCPLPFYHRKLVPYIISPYFPVFLGIFFLGQRYVCPLTANSLCFLTVLAAFQAFPPSHVCSLALRFDWLIQICF